MRHLTALLLMHALACLFAHPVHAAEFNRAPLNAEPNIDIPANLGFGQHVRLPNGALLLCDEFSRIGSEHRAGYAVINPDGSLNTQFNPTIDQRPGINRNYTVDACSIATSDTHLYIGGSFSSVNGHSAPGVARFLLSDYSLDTEWQPGIAARTVNAMAATDSHVFLQYESLDGVDLGDGYPTYELLAKIPTSPGVVAPEWQQFMQRKHGLSASGDGYLYFAGGTGIARIRMSDGAQFDVFEGGISGIRLISDDLLLAYGFQIQGQYGLVLVNTQTGATVRAWAGTSSEAGQAWVLDADVLPDGSMLAVGYIDSLDGVTTAPGLAKITADGEVVPNWSALPETVNSDLVAAFGSDLFVIAPTKSPNNWMQLDVRHASSGASATVAVHGARYSASGLVYDLLPSSTSGLFVSGNFRDYPGATRSGVLKLDSALQIDANFVPDLSRIVSDSSHASIFGVAEGGGKLMVSSGRSREGALSMISMLDAATGQRVDALATWDTDGLTAAINPVYDIQTGEFLLFQGMREAGAAVGYLGRINATTGGMDPNWHISNSGGPRNRDVVRHGGYFYVAHRHGSGGPTLTRIVDTTPPTHDATWTSGINWSVMDLALDANGDYLYVAGDFNRSDGSSSGLSRILLPAATVDLSWNPLPSPWETGEARALAVDGDGMIYIGGDFFIEGCSGRQHVSVLRIHPNGTIDTSWRVDADADIRSIIVREGDVLIGGWFSAVNDVPRASVASVGKNSQAIFADGIGDTLCLP